MHGAPIRSRAQGSRAGLRVAGRRVETAVWTLRHPRTGRTATLVGTMHIGDARYFDELSEMLAGLAAGGAEVHLEGIAHREDDRVTEWERARLAEAKGWRNPETSGTAVTLLRVESQSLLRLPEETRNIDLSHAELLRRLGWGAYRRLFALGPTTLPGPGLAPIVRAAIRFQLRHSRGLELLRSTRPGSRRVNRVVIDERNAVAFAGAADALERRDVVLVWGADHLPGLARLFARAGYRPLAERWLSACAV